MTVSNLILVGTTVCAALMAGLFFSYSVSVVPGLKNLPDSEYLAAMQSINREIQNWLFFIIFLGTLILLPVCTWLNFYKPITNRFWLLLVATIIYIVGAFGITALGNIPLNNSLEKFNLATASKEAIFAQRNLFENRWNFFNTIRTIASAISLIFAIIACVSANKTSTL